MGAVSDAVGGFYKKVGQSVGLVDPESKKYAEQAYAQFQNFNAPTLRNNELVSAGDYGQTFQAVGASPEGRAAQLQALQGLQGIVSGGGLSVQDKARMDEINRQVNTQNAAQQQAALQQAQLRGTSRSGTDIFANLTGGQASADRRAQLGLQTGAFAADRNMQAIQSLGQAGSNIRGQDESLGQFNAAQMAAARQMQLGNLQRISDINIGNKNITAQQNFANQMQIRAARAGSLQNIGAASDAGANRLGALVGAGVAAYAGGGAGSLGAMRTSQVANQNPSINQISNSQSWSS